MNLRKLSVLLAVIASASLTAKKDKDSVFDWLNQRVAYIAKTVTQIKDDIQCQTTIKKPKLTVILVTEDTSYNTINYLKPYLTGGLGTLINNGINYTNANYAEANASTGPGHASMATGALTQVHGIVHNNWFVNGVRQNTSSDYTSLSPRSLAYVANTSNGNQPGQTYPLSFNTINSAGTNGGGNGLSNRNLLADTLADQLVYFSTPQSTKQFFYVSNASVSDAEGFLPAGQLGKAFVFDQVAGGFTSTQAFYPSAVVTITDSTGTGALADAWVVDGVITKIVIENGGINYTNPTITITNPTYGPTGQIVPPTVAATATATIGTGLQAGQIIAINVTNGGAGYVGGLPDWVVAWNNAQNFNLITSWVQNLIYPANSPAYNLPNINNYSSTEFSAPSLLGIPQAVPQSGQPLTRTVGSGATALATVTNGVITALTLTNGGSGYTGGVTVTITGITSKGSLATATATAGGPGGAISALTLTNGGSGYTNPIVSIVGGSTTTNTTLGPIPNSAPFYNYLLSPDSVKQTFSFIETILDNNLGSTDELVIFVNIGVNLTEEVYGFQALEAVDMMYQLDQAFGDFITQVYNRVDPSEVLFGWISDEGCQGNLAYWQQAGYANAQALSTTAVRNTLNAAILTATGVAGAVTSSAFGNVWMAPIYFQQPAATQQIILQAAQTALQGITGVKSVYITSQLINTPFQLPEEDQYLKMDVFAGRSGQLMFSTQPMTAIAVSTPGGESRALWNPVYHSPLILYQQGQFENKIIADPVFIQQLPITLSAILEVPRPSGAPRAWGPLPGIYCNSSK